MGTFIRLTFGTDPMNMKSLVTRRLTNVCTIHLQRRATLLFASAYGTPRFDQQLSGRRTVMEAKE